MKYSLVLLEYTKKWQEGWVDFFTYIKSLKLCNPITFIHSTVSRFISFVTQFVNNPQRKNFPFQLLLKEQNKIKKREKNKFICIMLLVLCFVCMPFMYKASKEALALIFFFSYKRLIVNMEYLYAKMSKSFKSLHTQNFSLPVVLYVSLNIKKRDFSLHFVICTFVVYIHDFSCLLSFSLFV